MSRSVVCDALSCVHNRHHQCDATSIQVRPGRSHKKITYCSTFSFNPSPHSEGDGIPIEGSAAMVNVTAMASASGLGAIGMQAPIPYFPEIRDQQPPKVSCSASACVFNHDYRCGADPLHIDDPETPQADPAPCGTFRRE